MDPLEGTSRDYVDCEGHLTLSAGGDPLDSMGFPDDGAAEGEGLAVVCGHREACMCESLLAVASYILLARC